MSDTLEERGAQFEAEAKRINGDRQPKFGDRMLNPWAGENNPRRIAYFIRSVGKEGYEFTDGVGNVWTMMSGRTCAQFVDERAASTPASPAGSPITDAELLSIAASRNVPYVFGSQSMTNVLEFGKEVIKRATALAQAGAASPAPVAAITDDFQQAVSDFRKAAYERDLDAIFPAQVRLFDAFRAALAAAPQAQAAQQPVGETTEGFSGAFRAVRFYSRTSLPPGTKLYAAPVVAAAQIVDVIYKLMGACLIDWTEGEEFNTDAAERAFLMAKVQELIATPAAPVAPSEQTDQLEAAIQRAAGELPDGHTIRIEVERGAGWAEWEDDEGFVQSIDRDEGSFAERVIEAIKLATANADSAAAPAANPEPDGDLGAAHDAEGG